MYYLNECINEKIHEKKLILKGMKYVSNQNTEYF